MSTTWRNHRKRKRLRATLGADAVLAIMDLWSYAAEMHTDGLLRNMTPQDMADEVDYTGDAGRLVEALVQLGLLDPPSETCGHYSFHDWAEHQRWLVGYAQRSERAKRAVRIRHSKRELLRDKRMSATTCAHVPYDMATPLPSSPTTRETPKKEKKEEIHTTPRTKRAGTTPSPEQQIALLVERGVSQQVAEDYVALRFRKRAPLSTTSIATLEREARKAGITLLAVCEVCCANGWQGFRSEWLDKKRERPKDDSNGIRPGF